MWLLYRLVNRDFGASVASRAVIYLAIGPLSFFLQAVYTESLFLLLSLACFVFAREGRWRLAGLMGLLATLTRSTGVLLLIPMAYYYYERRDWKLKKTDSHVANLLMVVEGLLVWMTYLALAFGKPLAFSTAQAQWERGIGAPNYTVTRAIAATVWGLRQVVSAEYYRMLWEAPRPGSEYSNLATNLLNLLFLVAAALLLWYGARRLPGAYSWYALAALAYPLFFPSKYVPLMSYPRFTLTVFPLYVALALYTHGPAAGAQGGGGRRGGASDLLHGQVRDLQLGGLTAQGLAEAPGDGVAPGEGVTAPGVCVPLAAPTRLKTKTPSLANTDWKFGSVTSRPRTSENILGSSLS